MTFQNMCVTIIKPIKHIIEILTCVARNDCTGRLIVSGNDEFSLLSEYFNNTVAQVRSSIQSITKDTGIMRDMTGILASNMEETAIAINEMHGNIDGVKQLQNIRSISQNSKNSIENPAAEVSKFKTA